eukprot:SM000003S11072  [mRNA]  locus=s3:693500:701554:+ [translate_table: standard]
MLRCPPRAAAADAASTAALATAGGVALSASAAMAGIGLAAAAAAAAKAVDDAPAAARRQSAARLRAVQCRLEEALRRSAKAARQRVATVAEAPPANGDATSGSGSGGGRAGQPLPRDLELSQRGVALALAFGGGAALLHTLLSALPPDFLDRWRGLFSEQPHAEPSLRGGESRGGTVLYDCHGAVIATVVPGGFSGTRPELGRARRSTPLRPSEIPSAMWQAVVASEDRSFFDHRGFDPRGLSRALVTMARSGGGSTITQQLVKNVFLTNERKWARKLVEIILAVIIERKMSKWDILHLYLSKIYWGHGVNGIEAASALYFGKHPSLLTLGECAMLAGIIPAPELLSPYRDPSRGRKPQARALRRMVEAGFLNSATAARAVNEPLVLGTEAKQQGTSGPWRAPYFVSEVLHLLNQKYGREEILRGGLQVYTTLDLGMQDIAEKVVRDTGIELDRERNILAERGLVTARKKLDDMLASKQDQVLELVAAASAAAAARRDVEAAVGWEEESGRRNLSTLDALERAQEDDRAAAAAAAAAIKRYTTQEAAMRATIAAYEEEIKKAGEARLEGAMVAMDPADGAIRALVGGRDYYESNFNRATQALRPPGSTFKPLVYLTAFSQGIEKEFLVVDEPYSVGNFTPENYDRKFRGEVTLEYALLKSLNVPTVKLCAEVGVDKVCEIARKLGIHTSLPHELALSLGGCEVTPVQLATVYCTIASGGYFHKPHLITRVESFEGRVLEEFKPPDKNKAPVVDEYAVSELRQLLQACVERGTGKAAQLARPCAGKTGTSDGHRDVWFAGFTPQISTVVWLGYDDNAPVGGLHPATGAAHAAPMWKRFMSAAHEGLPVEKFHDIGRDKYGGRAPREFLKRSRRPQKSFLRVTSFSDPKPEYDTAWTLRPNYDELEAVHDLLMTCLRIGDAMQNWRGASEAREGSSLRQVVTSTWKDVWDWEKASSAWEEKEKMEQWASQRLERSDELRAMRAAWTPLGRARVEDDVSERTDEDDASFLTRMASSEDGSRQGHTRWDLIEDREQDGGRESGRRQGRRQGLALFTRSQRAEPPPEAAAALEEDEWVEDGDVCAVERDDDGGGARWGGESGDAFGEQRPSIFRRKASGRASDLNCADRPFLQRKPSRRRQARLVSCEVAGPAETQVAGDLLPSALSPVDVPLPKVRILEVV